MEEYSQQPLIKLLIAGAFPGEWGVPRHIQTVISNVFVFESRVYKLYKDDNAFFNRHFRDLSDTEERFSFTTKDFQWNQVLSPTIYTRLAYVVVRDRAIQEVGSADEAEEILMVMQRVDTRDILYEKIVSGALSTGDCETIGRQFGEQLKRIQVPPRVRHSFGGLFAERTRDIREWLSLTAEHFESGEIAAYCDFLDAFRRGHEAWFETGLTDEVMTDGDFHSQNAVYAAGTMSLMDTYPPKEEWELGHRLTGFYRMGVDIWALSGQEAFFEAFLRGYEEGNGIRIDRRLDALLIVYAACIAVSYFYMLQHDDPTKAPQAKQFHAFLRTYFSSLPTLDA